jgi:hypothetical protein
MKKTKLLFRYFLLIVGLPWIGFGKLSAQLSCDLLLPLTNDIDLNPTFKAYFDKDPRAGVAAYDLVFSYPGMRLKPHVLDNAKALIKDAFGILSPDQLKKIISENKALKGNAEALEGFLLDLKNFLSYKDRQPGFGNVIADLERGGSFADGANYVLAFLRKNPDEFPPDKVKFELRTGSREVDLELTTPNGTIRYEFKSYKWTSLPPSDFVKQFSADLNAVDDVAQLRWYFDAEKLVGKTEAELETYMLNEVRNLRIGPDIDPDQLNLLTGKNPGTIEDLIATLKSKKVFRVR